jgi:glycosyltransferase involved in cell wall biosynthesis
MDQPLVSVIIPVYSNARFLGAAIDSALAQTHPAIEVIAVDDGSIDGCADVLAGYGERIRCLRQPNGGPSIARRRGAEAARGEYLALLDADDVWDTHKIARQIDLMQRIPEAVATYCDHRRIDADGRVIAASGACYGLRGSGRIFDALLRGNFILTASVMLMRRDAYVRAGGFTDDRVFWGDDFSLSLRLSTCGAILYQAETLVSYRQHGANTSGSKYEQSRGDAHAFDVLVRHLQANGDSTLLPSARQARRRAYIAAAWHCRKRGEYRRALRYRLQA